MAHLQLGVALGGRAVDVAGQGIARSVLGVAETIADLCRSIRVNKDAAIALSRRIDELVVAIATELEHMKLQVGTEDWLHAIRRMEGLLLETQTLLAKQARQTYFQQMLYQERNKGLIRDAAEDVSRALSILMMQSHVHVSNMAVGIVHPIMDAYNGVLTASWGQRSPSPEPEGEAPPLPDPPVRFSGRQQELWAVLDAVSSDTTQVAILGAESVGKTALALAVLHDPAVADRFQARRYFVQFGPGDEEPCYLHMIGRALGLASRSDTALERKVRRKLADAPSLLVLDGFESAWAPLPRRAHAECLLQRLSEIPGLSLIVTLRGSQRPHGVAWHRPFLPPLIARDTERTPLPEPETVVPSPVENLQTAILAEYVSWSAKRCPAEPPVAEMKRSSALLISLRPEAKSSPNGQRQQWVSLGSICHHRIPGTLAGSQGLPARRICNHSAVLGGYLVSGKGVRTLWSGPEEV